MSLLWMDYDSEFHDLIDRTIQLESAGCPQYFATLDGTRKKYYYRDTRYNVDFLYTSYQLNDDKIMEDYAVWLFQLMHSILKHRTPEETVDYVNRHFDYICAAIRETIPAEKQTRLLGLMEAAKKAVLDGSAKALPHTPAPSRYEAEIQQYLDTLFKKDTRNALYLIHQFTERGISINDLYVEILAESMRRIGELWHTSQITVDTEHYCTSVTQMAMAQFYPALFETKRRNRTIICACPGTELHEMGSRMLSDLFENDGWDSVYLCAAVPEESMLDSIRENHPDLVALSVTMPQHLLTCRDLVLAIKKEFPDLTIAVGGKSFESTHHIWAQWPVDLYTQDARELLRCANKRIG